MGRFEVQTSGGMRGASTFVSSLVEEASIVSDRFDAISNSVSMHCTGW